MVRIRRLLIANRGEIAVRIVRACRESGVVPVLAATAEDADTMPARLADEIVEVPSYLDADALVQAATDTRSDAVHPGYGFLSEDADFADRVTAAGLVWVGPPPGSMRALGNKVTARAVADAAGVPTVPGIDVDGLSEAAIARAAAAIGVPLIVKAAAGGGGRGMRTVDDLDQLERALAGAKDEAASGFGDGRVFLERRMTHVRHVEIQILLDDAGNAVHLGERDCSLQRRHQKIVEESPARGVGAALRAALGEASIAIASRAGFRGVGTAEFLVDGQGTWWFLEMNTRLQVEHPVTEAVSGIDLVRAQLAIAAGDDLPIGQADVSLRGHAVEARVYAEDPANGFLPAGGTVARLDLPRWPGVRIDTALEVGDVVGTGFDPLLTKVIAWDRDRPAALARLRGALADLHIVGVTTNLGFLLDALGHPDVVDGRADTDWVEGVWTPEVPALPDGVHGADDRNDPWVAFGPGPSAAARTGSDAAIVAGNSAQFRGWAYSLEEDDLAESARSSVDGSLIAPMPATVLRVDVEEGETVAPGQAVALLEAMKIQVQLSAPTGGVIRSVRVHAGDVVARGETLVELEEA